MKISDFDSKMFVAEEDGFSFLDYSAPVLDLRGFPSFEENRGKLYRLRLSDREKYSEYNDLLAWCTSGGRLRFTTDAKKIKLKVKLGSAHKSDHFANTGVCGFDVYLRFAVASDDITDSKASFKYKYHCTVFPSETPEHTGEIPLSGKKTEVMINLPLYSGLEKLLVGFPEDALLLQASPYSIEDPLVFYGSSITQGGCASRPGMAYPAIISRSLDVDIINLGFSGSALGEEYMSSFIADLKMSAFIMDYDHNHSYEGLVQTHYPFYEKIRKAQPDLPIVFVSKCDYLPERPDDERRRQLIMGNYKRALSEGDKNVYFVDGSLFFGSENPFDYTVDGLHPTDLGFKAMADGILEQIPLAKILSERKA